MNFSKKISELENNHLLRSRRVSNSPQKTRMVIDGSEVVNFCSNDYLSLASHPKVKEAFIKGVEKYGSGSGASHLVSGHSESHKLLEEALSEFTGQENALIFSSGYSANLGIFSALRDEIKWALHDKLNHASLIDGSRIAGLTIQRYLHNNLDSLDSKLEKQIGPGLVVTDNVFSMDGDVSSLKEITEISQKSNAITIVDDAHGDFVMGKDGKGTPEHFNVAKKIDLYISSLSKGLGSFGGYVASQNNVIDLCINKSKPFIYTSALPSFLVQHSIKRIESDRETQKKKLENNVEKLARGLRSIGYEIKSNTQIIPIILGSEKLAMDFGKFLSVNGIFAQPIRYPTVPKNQARLRISVTAWLTNSDVEKSLKIFEKAYRKFL